MTVTLTGSTSPEWIFRHARLVRAIDGDTVVFCLEKEYQVEADFGFYIHDRVTLRKTTEQTFRLLGINTPEVVGAEKERGLAAKAELERLLAMGDLTLTSYKGDKYGRWLAKIEVTTPEQQTFCVNDELVRTGFAVVYNP